jgi:NAD(P)H-hydrate epimerase
MSGELQNLVLSQPEARAIDAAITQQLGLPGLLLMENAAHGVTEQLTQCAHGEVVIVCGPGNNGGDGLAVARQRSALGQTTRVLLETAGKPLSPDAQSNLDFLTRSGVDIEILNGTDSDCAKFDRLTPNDWIVDSLLGTGISGNLRAPYDRWANAINSSRARVLAVDVPSGLNCDDGTCGDPCVQADVTVTFVGMKRGFLAPNAEQWTGKVLVAPIGVPRDWVEHWLSNTRAH